MAADTRNASIFSQKLDRIVYTVYLLGAVVPLVALAFVAQHFVLPSLSDRFASGGLIGLVLSIASLSMGSFFALRRTIRDALQQMDRDNLRLESLLKAAGAFPNAQHEGEAAATAVRCALELTDANAVYAFVRADPSKPPTLLESLGDDAEKLLRRFSNPVTEMTNLVMTEGQPALRGPGDGKGWSDSAAAVVPLSGEDAAMGVLVALQTGTREPFNSGQVDALSTLAALASVSLRNSDLRDAQRNFFSHMTDLIVTALDAHLLHQNGHGNRVAQYANRVGRELGLDDRRLQRLHFAALLHDIGMLKIERSLLTNAKACEKHPQIGARMLERIRLWENVAPIVLHHHEWFDGTGYPEQLKGDAVPLESRIISVCEAFDAMISSSSYKVAMDVAEAAQELSDCAGTQFDPKIVEIFGNLVERGIIQPPTL